MALLGLVTPNITFVAGTTWVTDFTFLTNGSPTDLTGAQELWFVVKPAWDYPDSGALLKLTKTLANFVVSAPTTGVARLTIPPASTQSMIPWRSFVWDCKAKLADGTISVPNGYFNGIFMLYPPVYQAST